MVSRVLTTLNLQYCCNNCIGPSGASAIAEALKVNAVLTKLDLEYNRLDGESKQLLRNAVRSRDNFQLNL